MTKLEQIEKSVAALAPEELKAFTAWFEEFRADPRDRQMEADAKAGKLDKLAERHSHIIVQAGPGRFEALHGARILGRLQEVAFDRSTAGG
jgi:hypothetical protein